MERFLIRSQDLLQGIPFEVLDNQIGEGYDAVVLSADAQATIAALEETILKMGENAAVVAKDAMAAKEQVAALQARVRELQCVADEKCRCFLERAEQAEQQLTQRTAECDALKLVNDTHMKTVMTLSHIVEQQTAELEAVSNFIGVQYDAESRTWVSGQAPYQSAGTTKQEACIAAVDALRLACATWETKYRDLQAELERVRGELVEATHNVNVYQSLYSTSCMDRALLENDLRDLRTLIAALPKVEGEIEIYTGKNTSQVVVTYKRGVIIGTLYGLDHAKPVAALYKHRQGMEG